MVSLEIVTLDFAGSRSYVMFLDFLLLARVYLSIQRLWRQRSYTATANTVRGVLRSRVIAGGFEAFC